MTSTRVERDSLGAVHVAADRLWGAQTQRSLENFAIGNHLMPRQVIAALVLIKKAAARLNGARSALPEGVAEAISKACDEVLAGEHDDQFPLSVWQTGSGTHSNMNVNEVIANRASEMMGGQRGNKAPVHPNDHVNLAQSSNDVFSAAVYVASTLVIQDRLLPSVRKLAETFDAHAQQWKSIVKIGRTHLMDATPLTAGQEVSAWAAQLHAAHEDITQTSARLQQLAIGGTAVGTGLNAPLSWGDQMATELKNLTQVDFRSAENKFAALASHDAVVTVSGSLSALATALTKICNDIRLLSSGPRCGLGELILPENEPGSSIMPGKVNPSQAEAMLMVCGRVAGNHTTIFLAAASGSLQLNVAKPLLAHALLESCVLLADAMDSLRLRCVDGLKLDAPKISEQLARSLMLVTALTPEIGYDSAAKVAQTAHEQGITLREAAHALGLISLERFDEIVRPETMVGPHPG